MHPRIKAMLIGAFIGTIRDGLGGGTIDGALRGLFEYQRRFGPPDDDGIDRSNADTP